MGSRKINKGISLKDSGFSLLEICIVMIILGLMGAAFIQAYKIEKLKKDADVTNYAAMTISYAIAKFVSSEGRYPCPARSNTGTGSDDFGRETDCSDTSVAAATPANFGDGYFVTSNTVDGQTYRIRMGAVPFKALNIGKDDIIDAYKNRFTYVVTERQAIATDPDNLSGTYNPGFSGAISLQYRNDNQISTKYVGDLFFSHGANAAGSFTSTGNVHANKCASAAVDKENCDEDAEFIADNLGKSSLVNGQYDDTLVSNVVRLGFHIWDRTQQNRQNLYNRNKKDIGIGTQDPQEKLHIFGGNLRVDGDAIQEGDPATKGGNVNALGICSNETQDCFAPEILGGDIPSGISCANGQYMKRIANNEAVCVDVLMGTGSCNDGDFVTGIEVDMNNGIKQMVCTNIGTGSTYNVAF